MKLLLVVGLLSALTFVSSTARGGPNLIANPGFENGTNGWFVLGGTLSAATEQARSGGASGLSENRTETYHNETKWYHNEPQQGQLSYATPDAMYAICEANKIKVRGHCVFWAVDQYVQNWIKDLDAVELRAAVERRIDSVVGRYAGKFMHWDINNEMLHGSFYASRLGNDIRPWMFSRAKSIDSTMKPFVNDYAIITGGEGGAYIAQIKDLISAGAPVEGIGVQGHFGSSVDPAAVKARLDALAALGLPIVISEYDSVNADEQVRADNLEALYRVAFSHPSVEGILMWGFWAGAHWRGADAAIVDLDWTVNEAGRRYQSLLSEWTTTLDESTDASGQVSFRGFHGEYEVHAVGGPSVSFTLEPGATAKLVTLQLPGTLVDGGAGGDRGSPRDGSSPGDGSLRDSSRANAGGEHSGCGCAVPNDRVERALVVLLLLGLLVLLEARERSR